MLSDDRNTWIFADVISDVYQSESFHHPPSSSKLDPPSKVAPNSHFSAFACSGLGSNEPSSVSRWCWTQPDPENYPKTAYLATMGNFFLLPVRFQDEPCCLGVSTFLTLYSTTSTWRLTSLGRSARRNPSFVLHITVLGGCSISTSVPATSGQHMFSQVAGYRMMRIRPLLVRELRVSINEVTRVL